MSIHPLPPLATWQHRRHNLHHVQPPLKAACVHTFILPSFYALFDFFFVGIVMIVQPRRWRSDSPQPRPIPILTGGTPGPLRGRIPPRPFRGGPRTRPRPRRASRRCPPLSLLSLPPSSSSSAVSNPVVFVAFVVEVVPPSLRGKGRRAARAQTRWAWI